MIFYFSGTGNSKYVALKVSKELNIKSVSLNDYLKNDINDLDNKNDSYLGFIFPTYDYDIPYVLKDYLKYAKINNLKEDTFIFGIFTCGAKTGSSYKSLNNILNTKGLKLSLAYSLKMPDNSLPWFKPETKEEQTKSLALADKKLDIAISNLKDKKEVFDIDKALNPLFKWVVEKIMVPSQKSTKHFFVEDTCIGCKTCENICPMNCIKIVDNKPKWNDNICSACLSCLHRCPKGAIQYNKKTLNKPRYYNPNLKDIEN